MNECYLRYQYLVFLVTVRSCVYCWPFLLLSDALLQVLRERHTRRCELLLLVLDLCMSTTWVCIKTYNTKTELLYIGGWGSMRKAQDYTCGDLTSLQPIQKWFVCYHTSVCYLGQSLWSVKLHQYGGKGHTLTFIYIIKTWHKTVLFYIWLL